MGRTTDPVRMYMREMGTVELLTREGEIAIAKVKGIRDVLRALAFFLERLILFDSTCTVSVRTNCPIFSLGILIRGRSARCNATWRCSSKIDDDDEDEKGPDP